MTEPWERRERIGDCILYLGDCREIVQTLRTLGAVITDPPYGMGDLLSRSATGSRWRKHFENGPLTWDEEAPLVAVKEAVTRALVSIVWGGQFFDLPPSRGWLVWNKMIRNWTSSECELAWTNIPQPVRAFDYSHGQLASEGKHYHPTQKPVPLMKWCIEQVHIPVDVITDPFMGSGSTGVACAQLRRTFIGIERDCYYFEGACERIENAYRQGVLFSESKESPQQATLLGTADALR